jgi:hypothetical protein
MADDIAGQSVASTTMDSSGGGGLSGSSMLGLGALGVGAGGLAAILGQGESPLPGEFSQLTASVPTLQSQGATVFGEGQGYLNQGAQALQMAQNGQLTQPQQAQLQLFREGESNKAAQTYAGMGRNINQDTSGISTQSHIDAEVNAMAQQQIQTTIALGLGETSAGGSLTGQALGFENVANQALIAAGNAQLQQDKDYSTALTGAFSSIATILGGAAKLAPALAV